MTPLPKIVGVLTEDFEIYYDLVSLLKAQSVPFISLVFDDPIPASVGAILTTVSETDRIRFEHVIGIDPGGEETVPSVADHAATGGGPRRAVLLRAVNRALHLLRGGREYELLIIGIDPGKRPGLAIIGDGTIIATHQARSPEHVASYIEQQVDTFPSKRIVVRVGHGARTQRNRIINQVFPLGHRIEIVDETNTTERVVNRDIRAAINIAITRGYRVQHQLEVVPTEGELKNIQRLSRLESQGQVTISRDLARAVALGKLTLRDAIVKQNNE